MASQNDYPTPKTQVNRNSGIQPPIKPITQATKIQYPKPPAQSIPANASNSGIIPVYPKPSTQSDSKTVLQTSPTILQNTKPVATAKTTEFKLPQIPNLNLKQNILPLVGSSIVVVLLTPMLLNIFPQPRVMFQKALRIPSQECKGDDGKYLAGNVLILGQDGKTNILYSCRDSILNGQEGGVKRGLSSDGKSFALPAGNYVINKATKFRPADENKKPIQLPFLFEFAAQEKGKNEIKNNLAALDSSWATTHKVGSVGMIYPVNYESNDFVKGNEIALEIGVKPDSTIYQLSKLGYLEGATLVVRTGPKP